jgi:hypothetical protein
LAGINMRARTTRTTASGDAFEEWEYTVERSPEVVQSIAELPRSKR